MDNAERWTILSASSFSSFFFCALALRLWRVSRATRFNILVFRKYFLTSMKRTPRSLVCFLYTYLRDYWDFESTTTDWAQHDLLYVRTACDGAEKEFW